MVTEGETGGMLVGYVQEAEGSVEYEITHATPPGRDSRLASRRFTRGADFAKHRLDYLASKFGVRYLGEWHKHPAPDTPRASNTDRATMRAIARKPTYDIQLPVLVIANEDGRKLTLYASDRRRVVLICERDLMAGADPPASLE
ncbi:MAG: Mov34/MPN/PAD-1 family protein [Actinomycetota bacterium]|nr:Mov34/MPN/PAD-1 family protein [Actinomycetota bacterium]